MNVSGYILLFTCLLAGISGFSQQELEELYTPPKGSAFNRPTDSSEEEENNGEEEHAVFLISTNPWQPFIRGLLTSKLEFTPHERISFGAIVGASIGANRFLLAINGFMEPSRSSLSLYSLSNNVSDFSAGKPCLGGFFKINMPEVYMIQDHFDWYWGISAQTSSFSFRTPYNVQGSKNVMVRSNYFYLTYGFRVISGKKFIFSHEVYLSTGILRYSYDMFRELYDGSQYIYVRSSTEREKITISSIALSYEIGIGKLKKAKNE